MNLDFSKGFCAALGISEEALQKYSVALGDEIQPYGHAFDALLAIGTEPVDLTLDVFLENIGHMNIAAESRGFIHFKEIFVKVFVAKLTESNGFYQWLNYFKNED